MYFLGLTQFISNFLYLEPKSFILCILAILTYVVYKVSRKPRNLPPGPYGLPFVGYLPFLGDVPHKTLKKLSDKYGNIFSFYLGGHLVIVIGDYATTKEALLNPNFLGRPPESVFDLLPEKFGMATNNGLEWQEQRRQAITTLKSLISKIHRLEETIEGDLMDVIKELKQKGGKPLVLRPHLTASTVNNIWFLLFGERITYENPLRKFLSDATNTMAEYFGFTSAAGFFTWLPKVYSALKIGGYREALAVLNDVNILVRKEVDKRVKQPDPMLPDHFISDYIDKMDKNTAKDGNSKFFSIPTLRGTVQGFFFGGSETTRTSLEWALYTMATFPDIQKRVQAEIDEVIGRERRVFWKDHNDMPYTQAFLAEMQRWKTIVPINGSRYALEDVTFGGYHIPKGSIIMMNTWAIHSDPKTWINPEEFRPERFLSKDGKTFIKPDAFMPFSMGRRKCPGEEMAILVIFIYFTTILQTFNVKSPGNTKPNLDDFVMGLTYQPVENKLCFIPRE